MDQEPKFKVVNIFQNINKSLDFWTFFRIFKKLDFFENFESTEKNELLREKV